MHKSITAVLIPLLDNSGEFCSCFYPSPSKLYLKPSSQTIRKCKEAVVILLTNAHPYAIHDLQQSD